MNTNYQNKKILILGAGTWLVPHIKKAKEIGLKTFVTDWSDDAPGREFADVFAKIDLKDAAGTLRFAKEHNVDAIYTSADIGVQTAAYVADCLGLKYHSKDLAYNATNKNAMRNQAKKSGISIPEYFATSQLGEAKSAALRIGYPVIIKPVDSFSSRGVSVLKDEAELEAFFSKSIEASIEGKILIEEFMVGTEGSVEALVKNGKARVMGVCDKVKSELPYRYDLQLNYPGAYSKVQTKEIEKFVDTLVEGFNIKSGIVHIEIMVRGNLISLIEFGVRACGSKVVTHLLPKMLGFDIVKYLLLDSLSIEQEIIFTQNYHGVLKFVLLKPGKVRELSGKEEVLDLEGVVDFDIEREVGDIIEVAEDGRSRHGYLLSVAKNKEKVDGVVETAMEIFNIRYG